MEVGKEEGLYACRYTVTTRMTSAERLVVMGAILMFDPLRGK